LRTKAVGSGVPGQRRHHRDAAHLQSGQHLRALRNQHGHLLGQLVEQPRVGLELVFVEVLVGYAPGAQDELAGQAAHGADLPREVRVSHNKQA